MNKEATLGMRLARVLLIAALCAVSLFALMQVVGSAAITHYLDNSDYIDRHAAARVESLQAYVTENDLAATDSAMLRKWCQRQPLVLMEVFRGDKLVFNSSYLDSEDLVDRDIAAQQYDWFSYYTIDFADGPAELCIYCDDAYRLQMWATIVEAVFCFAVFFLIFFSEVRKVARYIRTLNSEIKIMEGGVLDRQVTVQGSDELGTLAKSLDSMRMSLLDQREAEARSYQANQSLVTGLSHDLRTPLTKLMLYTEIIRSGKYGDEANLKGYLDRIDEIAVQIKGLSDNILLYSMERIGQPKVECESASVGEAIGSELDGLADYLEQRGFDVRRPLSYPEGLIVFNRSHVKRLFDNIASNVVKYADSAEPVYIECKENDAHVGLSVRNAIGGNSGQRDSSGIGQVNIDAMMRSMGGTSNIQEGDGAYTTTIWFQRTAFADGLVEDDSQE